MELLRSVVDGQVKDLEILLEAKDDGINECDTRKIAPLHYAAWYNKKGIAESLLNHGADPNIRDGSQSTPLHYAARYKQRTFQTANGEIVTSESSAEVTKLLLERGADVNASNEYGDSPLGMAVIRGNEEVVQILIGTDGVDLENADKRGWTPMHYAAKFERIDIGKLLIDKKASVSPATERRGTPLMLAAAEGCSDFVNLLLESCTDEEEKEAMVNFETTHGESALDFAVENKRKGIVELLIENGAKVLKTCQSTQMSPLHLSALAGGPEISTVLLDNQPGLIRWVTSNQATALHLAAQQGRVKLLRNLLKHGGSLEATDHDNLTPLLTSVEHGKAKALKVLLNHGANLTALTKDDQSAIHLCALHNRLECIEILFDRIKNDDELKERIVSADDKVGNSPLHLAAEEGHSEITKVLLDNGADIENINEEEETPIHVAARCGKTEIVEMILKSTDDNSVMNSMQEEGDTPLHLAAFSGHDNVVGALLEAGADVSIRNRQFWTPLACAASHGHVNVVRRLIHKDAEIEPTDKSRRTPLHLAAISGHSNVLKLLLKHGASVSTLDKEGNNALDLAIHFNQKSAAMTIVTSEWWKEALRNRTHGKKPSQPYTTPLRKLMKSMPDVVEKVFDNCITYTNVIDVKDPDLEIKMNFEFLDDTYSCASWGDSSSMRLLNNPNRVYESDGNVNEFAKPYTEDSHIREANHPLQTLVDCKCGELLYHPLVLGLVRHKWRLAQMSYFSFLLFYMVFVAMFTWNMVATKPPFYYNRTLLDMSIDNDTLCTEVWDSVETAIYDEPDGGLLMATAALQWILCLVGITTEFLQIYSTPARYISSPTNLMDWFTYIAVMITLIPIHPCLIATDWQWQLGSAAMFVAWMNFILYLRRLPGVGIYVVMVGVICSTFFKFFVFCFSLFVFAFGFTFYVLLRNKVAFSTPGYAFMKTGVMMIGEIEFEDLFHGEDSDFETEMYYEGISYVVFILFLCIATIIIMNLLTGLAVGDVQEIQEHARQQKLAMQIELALDVEVGLTENLRRYFKLVVGHLDLRPNKMGKPFARKFYQFLSGPLSSKAIAEAMYQEAEEEQMALEEEQEETKGEVANSQVMAEIESTRQQMKTLDTKMSRLEAMMSALLAHSGVQVEIDEPQETDDAGETSE